MMILSGILWGLLLLSVLSVFIMTASGTALVGVILLILVPLISWGWNLIARRWLHTELSFPATGMKLNTSSGEILVQPGMLRPAGRLYCRLKIHNDLTGEEFFKAVKLVSDPEGYKGLCYLNTAHCGRLSIQAKELMLCDLFGFLPVPRKADAVARMTVLPHMYPARINADFRSAAPEDSDSYEEERRGNDFTETFQLREYVPGDNLHGIHWKLSSKIDKLIYRDPGEPTNRSLLLFWDPEGGSPAVLDALAEVIFSVGQKLSEDGYSYNLGRFDSGFPTYEEVNSQEELIATIPTLLRKTAHAAGTADLSRFGHVLYFTASVPAMELTPETRVLYCGEEAGQTGNIIGFTPDNYQEILQKLDFGYE